MNSNSYILVVEDSKEIRDLLGDLYISEGYDVVLASDGKDALKKLHERSDLPSFILLDLMMVGMDGTQFLTEQKKDPRFALIPVIIMTADANAREKANRVGAKGYIRKPAEIDAFLAVATKYCNKIV